MALFDVDVYDMNIAFQRIRSGQHSMLGILRSELEHLWNQYEPYADIKFPDKFARDPDSRFWEMYLTVELVRAGKKVRPRSELPTAIRDHGPDICIVENARTIWIEAVTPELGDSKNNPDRVPEIIPISEGGDVQPVPRRQIELRINSVLEKKRTIFEKYRENGLIAQSDVCVVAISGARFLGLPTDTGLSMAATAVYPFGDPYLTMDRQTGQAVNIDYRSSTIIGRTAAQPIPRYAFLCERFAGVSGLIWSRRALGNFVSQMHDFVFVHNFVADIPFPRDWFPWDEENVVDDMGDDYVLTRIRACCPNN